MVVYLENEVFKANQVLKVLKATQVLKVMIALFQVL
jgi:hypothetical protein